MKTKHFNKRTNKDKKTRLRILATTIANATHTIKQVKHWWWVNEYQLTNSVLKVILKTNKQTDKQTDKQKEKKNIMSRS